VAAPLGNGNQYMSWIHLDDLAALYAFALGKDISGIYNGVAPHPVINSSFTKIAAKEKGKLFLPVPVPAFMLKLILGEMANMVIGGSKVSSEKIQNSGFNFKFPFLQEALQEIFSHK
jgi:NAD dependent epimerase/dehydratase family enzyme